MSEANVPIYLVNGFLDGGKTTLLRDTMAMDYFNDGQRTVLLRCEDGECEFDQAFLSRYNTRLVPVEDMEQLNIELFTKADRLYKPERVLVEYNGMWPMERILTARLPKRWGLFQIITVLDGGSFENYLANMQSLVVDMVSNADMVLINRCTGDMPLSGWKRSIRAVNRMGQIIFEDDRGTELEVEDILPYSLEDPAITLEDADYGIWYLDIQEHPERYVGKTITYKAQAMTGAKLPKGTFVPGRNAMTCCADDIRFFGFLCKYPGVRSIRKGEWITVTAQIRWENSPAYEGEGVVLYAREVGPARPPEEALVYFR